MSESWPFPRLYWTRDRSALVEERNPRAAFLAWSGHEPVPDAAMALYSKAETKQSHEPTEDKRLHDPIEDKAMRRPSRNQR